MIVCPIDLWQPAHPSRWRVGPRPRRPSLIVVHATSGGPNARNTADRWSRPPAKDEDATCAHFAIGQDGFLIQVVHLDDIAKHAHLANGRSIGIEFCAREPGEFHPDDAGSPPTAVQLAKGAWLLAWLCEHEGIACARANILGHAEADPATTHKMCPTAAGIDLDRLTAAAVAFRP